MVFPDHARFLASAPRQRPADIFVKRNPPSTFGEVPRGSQAAHSRTAHRAWQGAARPLTRTMVTATRRFRRRAERRLSGHGRPLSAEDVPVWQQHRTLASLCQEVWKFFQAIGGELRGNILLCGLIKV